MILGLASATVLLLGVVGVVAVSVTLGSRSSPTPEENSAARIPGTAPITTVQVAVPSATAVTPSATASAATTSAAIARFTTNPVTPPAAVRNAWGLGSADALSMYAQMNRGRPTTQVLFQSLGTVAGVAYWGVFARDSAGGGVICMVTKDPKAAWNCEVLSEFLAHGDVATYDTEWVWAKLTWSPDGSFGLVPITGVTEAEAASPAIQAINNNAPDVNAPAVTRLQAQFADGQPVLGEARSTTGTVFGLAADATLTRVCITPLDSGSVACGSGEDFVAGGITFSTAHGNFQWSPNGTVTPVS